MKKIINYTSPASTVKIPKNLTNQIQISYRLKIKGLEFFEFRASKSPLNEQFPGHKCSIFHVASS